MIKVEPARGRQITLAQLVVACRQRIRGQRQLVPRRTGEFPERVRLGCPVESRGAWSVMVDAVLAALVIVEQTLAQFCHQRRPCSEFPYRSARKCATPSQNISDAPSVLCSAPGTTSQVFGPSHASKSARERSVGMMVSASPTIASSGIRFRLGSARGSKRGRSNSETGSHG